MISRGGGFTNAYTDAENTNYYFSIRSEGLKDALQVFSHFFIDPSFKDEMVNKEVNAVNSEYEIDVSGDGWKLMHLFSLLSGKDHPMSRFTIGNNKSLMKKDVIEALRKYHESHYSSNLMTVAIRSKLDLSVWLQESSELNKIVNKELVK